MREGRRKGRNKQKDNDMDAVNKDLVGGCRCWVWVGACDVSGDLTAGVELVRVSVRFGGGGAWRFLEVPGGSFGQTVAKYRQQREAAGEH